MKVKTNGVNICAFCKTYNETACKCKKREYYLEFTNTRKKLKSKVKNNTSTTIKLYGHEDPVTYRIKFKADEVLFLDEKIVAYKIHGGTSVFYVSPRVFHRCMYMGVIDPMNLETMKCRCFNDIYDIDNRDSVEEFVSSLEINTVDFIRSKQLEMNSNSELYRFRLLIDNNIIGDFTVNIREDLIVLKRYSLPENDNSENIRFIKEVVECDRLGDLLNILSKYVGLENRNNENIFKAIKEKEKSISPLNITFEFDWSS